MGGPMTGISWGFIGLTALACVVIKIPHMLRILKNKMR